MFLHSGLTVVERSEHSFDPFPDKGRGRVVDKRTGRDLGEELLKRNCALVTYEPIGVDVIDCTLRPASTDTPSGSTGAPEPLRVGVPS